MSQTVYIKALQKEKMDEKHDLKMTRFENYASFVVMVQILRFMVQNTSILSKDFNEGIFG